MYDDAVYPYAISSTGVIKGSKMADNIAMFFPTSKTFTVVYTGKYRLSALGGGGSGGAIFTTTTGGAASGGAGGAFCEKEVDLLAGDELILVVGLPGAGVSSTVSGTGVAGNAGTESSIHGTSINMHAPGGTEGLYTTVDTTTIVGGTCNIATGGTINYAGGSGGSAKHYTNGAESGGGGASGSPFGTGGSGGYSIAVGAIIASGGGGAVGEFIGGNVSVTSTLGGGAGTGSSASGSTPGVNRFGIYGPSSVDGFARNLSSTASTGIVFSFDSSVDPFRGLTGGCGAETGGSGAGGTGTYGTVGFSGGVCGGGGGVASASAVTSGGSPLGGGSGGATSTLTGPATSANGGPGIVVIERIG